MAVHIKSLDAEHTNDPNDNHENDPRYDRDNDDRGNAAVRAEQAAAKSNRSWFGRFIRKFSTTIQGSGAAYHHSAQFKVTLSLDRLSVYTGLGTRLGADLGIGVNYSENITGDYPKGITMAGGKREYRAVNVTISEGGVDAATSAGAGLGAYVGTTTGYTHNYEF